VEEVKIDQNGPVTFKKPRKQQQEKPVRPKPKKLKRVALPQFPVTAYQPASLDVTQSKESVVTQLMKGMLDQQCDELDKTYTGQLSYVAKSARDLSDDFIKELPEVLTKVIKSQQEEAKKPNPKNDESLEEVERWKYYHEIILTQIKELENSSRKLVAERKKALDPAAAPLNSVDSEFLKGSCKDTLQNIVPQTYKSHALKLEALLMHLRQISNKLTHAREIQTSVANTLNASALNPYSGDPRSLIQTSTSFPATPRKEA